MKFIDSHHDRWHLAAGEDGPLPHPSPADQLLLTLEQWHAVRSHWSAQATAGKPLGLQLANDADVRVQKASFLFEDTLVDVCGGAACAADHRD